MVTVLRRNEATVGMRVLSQNCDDEDEALSKSKQNSCFGISLEHI